jgi:histidine triad (HIT) family protein
MNMKAYCGARRELLRLTLTIMVDCGFCKISKHESPAHVVYENDSVIAFLDKHPIHPGHILVVPKTHEPDFYKLDDKQFSELMFAVKKLSGAVHNFAHPKKVGLIIAGWDVPHTHVHIVPMHEYHDITSKSLLEGKKANPVEKELAQTANELKALTHS